MSAAHRQVAADATSTERVRELFDRESRRWGRRYAEGGSMEGRVQRFADALRERVGEGARVLDFGCGAGHIARALAERGYRVSGCDISPGMLEQARREEGGDAVTWAQLEATERVRLPFPDAAFDAVIASSVLEYVESPGSALSELARVVRPGGWVLATVPDERHPGRVAERRRWTLVRVPWLAGLLRRTRLRDYVEYLLLSVNRLEIETWQALARGAGLAPDPIRPCGDPLALLAGHKPGSAAPEPAAEERR